ncbi:MAG: 30S ribosome-binding factor RbfA [Acholeplasmatales bacterium]|nr:30S ribosome-binding factor RbfA [Acholeplasmatales bacterium]
MGLSLERLESLSLRELSLLFRRDPKGNGLSNVSVTEVRITRDLSFMTIFYSFYQGTEEYYQNLLETNKVYIRFELAKKIKARKMPDLIFKRDTSLDYGNHIEDLLSEIHKKEENK